MVYMSSINSVHTEKGKKMKAKLNNNDEEEKKTTETPPATNA